MSTFIINLNDTIAMNDTIVVKVMKTIESSQLVINEAETNFKDVWIVVAICATITISVGIVAWVLYIWISEKNKYQMAELNEKMIMNELERKKQDMDMELFRQDAECVREQKKKVDELKNKKTEQDLTIEMWEAYHKKAENELHRERYKQETEQAKLDAELERKIRENESEKRV
jgi:hypothetical protein